MSNEFKVKNGLIVAQGGASITGSVTASLGFFGDATGITGVVSSSYALTSSFAESASAATSLAFLPDSSSFATTASHAEVAKLAQTATTATSASFATTASAATSLTFTPSTASHAETADDAVSSSYSVTSSAATSITFTPSTASFATTASHAEFAKLATSASHGATSSLATAVLLANETYIRSVDSAGGITRILGLTSADDVFVGALDSVSGLGRLYFRVDGTDKITLNAANEFKATTPSTMSLGTVSEPWSNFVSNAALISASGFTVSGSINAWGTANLGRTFVSGDLFVTGGNNQTMFAIGDVAGANRLQTYTSDPKIRFLDDGNNYAIVGMRGLSVGGGIAGNAPPTNGLSVQGILVTSSSLYLPVTTTATNVIYFASASGYVNQFLIVQSGDDGDPPTGTAAWMNPGGLFAVGAGESAFTFRTNYSSSILQEDLYLTSDGHILLLTNIQVGWNSRRGWLFSSLGNFYPSQSGVQDVGTGSLPFRDAYFSGTGSFGKLSGDGSGITGVISSSYSLSSSNVTTASYALVAESSPSAIGGTGTATYVPRWLNSTTLENSRIIDSGSHILMGHRVSISASAPVSNSLLTVGDFWPIEFTPNVRTAAVFNKSSVGTVIQIVGNTATNSQTELWFSATSSEARGRVRYELDADVMELWAGGAHKLGLDSAGTFYPAADATQDLGSGSLRFRDAYFSRTGSFGALIANKFVSGTTGIFTETPSNGPAETLYIGNRALRFGQQSGDEVNAGHISYRSTLSDALSLVGAGITAGARKVHIFDILTIGSSPTTDQLLVINPSGIVSSSLRSNFFSSGSASFQLLGGDNSDAALGYMQASFGYWGTGYRHNIRTRHNAGSNINNSLSIFLWTSGTNAQIDYGSFEIVKFDRSIGTTFYLPITSSLGIQGDGSGITGVISSSYANTASYALVAESSPSAIGGTGTATYVPRWLNSTTLEDSRISDNGTVITMNGTTYIFANPLSQTFALNVQYVGTSSAESSTNYAMLAQGIYNSPTTSSRLIGAFISTDPRDSLFTGSSPYAMAADVRGIFNAASASTSIPYLYALRGSIEGRGTGSVNQAYAVHATVSPNYSASSSFDDLYGFYTAITPKGNANVTGSVYAMYVADFDASYANRWAFYNASTAPIFSAGAITASLGFSGTLEGLGPGTTNTLALFDSPTTVSSSLITQPNNSHVVITNVARIGLDVGNPNGYAVFGHSKGSGSGHYAILQGDPDIEPNTAINARSGGQILFRNNNIGLVRLTTTAFYNDTPGLITLGNQDAYWGNTYIGPTIVSGSLTASGSVLVTGSMELRNISSSAVLRLTADDGNVDEGATASLYFSQDGGITVGRIGLNETNDLVIGANSTTAPNIVFATAATGQLFNEMTARWYILNDGTLRPGADNAYDAGIGTFRIRSISAVNVSASAAVSASNLILGPDIGNSYRLRVSGAGHFVVDSGSARTTQVALGRFIDSPTIALYELQTGDADPTYGQDAFFIYTPRWTSQNFWLNGSPDGDITLMSLTGNSAGGILHLYSGSASYSSANRKITLNGFDGSALFAGGVQAASFTGSIASATSASYATTSSYAVTTSFSPQFIVAGDPDTSGPFGTQFKFKLNDDAAGNPGAFYIAGRGAFAPVGATSPGFWFGGSPAGYSAFHGLTDITSGSDIGFWHGGAWRLRITNVGRVKVGNDLGLSELLQVSGGAFFYGQIGNYNLRVMGGTNANITVVSGTAGSHIVTGKLQVIDSLAQIYIGAETDHAVRFIVNNVPITTLTSTQFYPSTTDATSLGISSNRWSNIYAVNISGSSITGSLSGSISNATSASYALTASFAENAGGSVGPGTINTLALFDSANTVSSSIISQSANGTAIEVNGNFVIYASSSYYVGPHIVLYKDANGYVRLANDGSAWVTTGTSGDPSNYYDATTHVWRSKDSAANYLILASAGLNPAQGAGALRLGQSTLPFGETNIGSGSSVVIHRQDTSIEGGEIVFSGSNANLMQWHLDNYQNVMRWVSLSTERYRFATSSFTPGVGAGSPELGTVSLPWGESWFGKTNVNGNLSITGSISGSGSVIMSENARFGKRVLIGTDAGAINAALYIQRPADIVGTQETGILVDWTPSTSSLTAARALYGIARTPSSPVSYSAVRALNLDIAKGTLSWIGTATGLFIDNIQGATIDNFAIHTKLGKVYHQDVLQVDEGVILGSELNHIHQVTGSLNLSGSFTLVDTPTTFTGNSVTVRSGSANAAAGWVMSGSGVGNYPSNRFYNGLMVGSVRNPVSTPTRTELIITDDTVQGGIIALNSAPTYFTITTRTNHPIRLAPFGGNAWLFNNASGHLILESDNISDIGASGSGRPRDIFAGRVISSSILRAPIIEGALRNYVETTSSVVTTAGTVSLDLTNGNVFYSNLTESVLNMEILSSSLGRSPTGSAASFTWVITYAGSFSITWHPNIKWPSDTAPTLTAAAGKTDIFTFVTALPSESKWFGFNAGQNYTG